jgi:hypothetical protein
VHRAVVARVQDPHPRVRYAACNCLGQLASDFGYLETAPSVDLSSFQSAFHGTVLPAILFAMDDASSPRVMAHAASALVNFAEGAEQRIMEGYLREIIQKLFKMLRVGIMYVQYQALQTLAMVAESAQTAIAEVRYHLKKKGEKRQEDSAAYFGGRFFFL